MGKKSTLELCEIKKALNLDDSFYRKLRTDLVKKGVLPPSKQGKRIILEGKAFLPIHKYLYSKDPELAKKFFQWLISRTRESYEVDIEDAKALGREMAEVVMRQLIKNHKIQQRHKKT